MLSVNQILCAIFILMFVLLGMQFTILCSVYRQSSLFDRILHECRKINDERGNNNDL